MLVTVARSSQTTAWTIPRSLTCTHSRPKHYGAALHPEDQVHIVPLSRSDSQRAESEVEMLRRMMIYSVRRELVPRVSQTFREYRLCAGARESTRGYVRDADIIPVVRDRID